MHKDKMVYGKLPLVDEYTLVLLIRLLQNGWFLLISIIMDGKDIIN
jgi:hypothetical protein